MRYQISWEILDGVPNILGNFAWGTKYPRKFSVQDAVFPGLEGGSKFSGGIPFFLGKIVRRYAIFPGVTSRLLPVWSRVLVILRLLVRFLSIRHTPGLASQQ